jgi:regulator of nucleoside diphosphate kinase
MIMQNNIAAQSGQSRAPDAAIVLTRADYRELLPFTAASRQVGDIGDLLAEKLETAVIVESSAVPPAVVTMNTELEVRDESNGHVSRLILVHPREANIVAGRISVMTPVGAALLGLTEGASTRVQGPSGEERTLTVLRVLMQPEARGRLTMPPG